MKKSNILRHLGRNALALVKRIHLAIRHKDETEILVAIINLMEEGMWLTCVLGFIICIACGFFKPHCWIMATFFAFLIGIVRVNISDRRELEENSNA